MPPKKSPVQQVNYDRFLDPYLKSNDKPEKILADLKLAGVDIKNNKIIEQFAKHKNPKVRILGAHMALDKGDRCIVGKLAEYSDKIVLKEINTYLSNVLKSAARLRHSSIDPVGVISIIFLRYTPSAKEAKALSMNKNWRIRIFSMTLKKLSLARIKEMQKKDKKRAVKLFAKLIIDRRASKN